MRSPGNLIFSHFLLIDSQTIVNTNHSFRVFLNSGFLWFRILTWVFFPLSPLTFLGIRSVWILSFVIPNSLSEIFWDQWPHVRKFWNSFHFLFQIFTAFQIRFYVGISCQNFNVEHLELESPALSKLSY